MKGQILSRIQSYQNIPISLSTNLNRISANQSSKIVNEAKFLKYTSIARQTSQHSIKVMSPSPKVNSHRMLFSAATINSNKKKLSNTINKQVKRSLNFGNQTAQKSSDFRNYKNNNCKLNERQLPYKNWQKQTLNQPQNQPNKQNTLKYTKNPFQQNSQKSQIKKPQKINIQLFKQPSKHNIARRKDLMRIYSKIELSKFDKLGIGSEKNINIRESNQDNNKDPQIHHSKNHLMMKTINVFKDYKKSPYLNFSTKKFSIKSPQKKIPIKSQNRIPIATLMQKQKQEDVSIQISVDENYKDNQQITQNQSLQFGCSQIKQKSMENDSSFLEGIQKNIINQIEQPHKNHDTNEKKKWKKLPNDFLKL